MIQQVQTIDLGQQTDLSPREKFLANRKMGIGGSDAAAALGLSPYKTPLDLYFEKRGEIEPEDLSDNAAVLWGNNLESAIMDHYAETTGYKLRRHPKQMKHREYPFLIANVDALVLNEDGLMDGKTSGAHMAKKWGASGTDEILEDYIPQGQHYLAVTGRKWIDFAVLIGGRDYRVFRISRDEELIDMMIPELVKFWQNHVLAGIPPPVDCASPGAARVIKKLYPGTNGQTVYLSDEALEWHTELVAARKAEGDAKKRKEEYSARLLSATGENAVAVLPDGSQYERKLTTRDGYTVKPTEYVAFRHYGKKG